MQSTPSCGSVKEVRLLMRNPPIPTRVGKILTVYVVFRSNFYQLNNQIKAGAKLQSFDYFYAFHLYPCSFQVGNFRTEDTLLWNKDGR